MNIRCLFGHRWIVISYGMGERALCFEPSCALRCDRCEKRQFVKYSSSWPILWDEDSAISWVKAQGQFNPGEDLVRVKRTIRTR